MDLLTQPDPVTEASAGCYGDVADRRIAFAGDLRRFGDRVALVEGGTRLSYADLAARCDETADALGSTRRLVLVEAGPSLRSVTTYLAALRAGHPVLIAGGGNPTLTRALVEHFDPDVVVSGRSTWRIEERRRGTRHELHPDLAALMPTSGSTGATKLARLSHENLQSNAASIADYLQIDSHDRAMLALPLSYCYGMSVLHSHLLHGATTVLTSRSVTDPRFWAEFRQAEATTFPAVPYTFDLLDRIGFERLDLPSLRYITQAGGRLAPATVRRYAHLGAQRGWKLVVMYGQTEATARMAFLPPDLAERRPEAIGRPIPGGRFTIEPSTAAPPGCGELVYRGPNVMLGYAQHKDDLARGRTQHALRTGDLGRQRADGLYELVGRASRFVKIFGQRLDLDEIERRMGEAGMSVLCTGNDETLALAVGHGTDLDRAVLSARQYSGLPATRIVARRWRQLPRLVNGKPDYSRIRADASAPSADAPGAAVVAEGADLGTVYTRVLGKPAGPDDSFVSLGGDSLSYVELASRIERQLGYLPADWPNTSIHQLANLRTRRRTWLRQIETNIALRAAGIILIVAAHLNLWPVRGGGHILLAVAGYGFARFQLTAARRAQSARPMLRSALRIALPSMLFIAVLALLGDGYDLANIMLINHYLGPPAWDQRWNYWFIEALVEILLVLSALFAIPALRRLEARRGFAVAMAFVVLGLAMRSNTVGFGSSTLEMSRPYGCFWIFALGWAAQRTTSLSQRLALSAAIVITLPCAFPDDQLRNAVIAAGILALTWVATLRLPSVLALACSVVAAASLHIYLTHWIVYPWLLHNGAAPVVAAGGAITAGVVAALLIRRAITLLKHQIPPSRACFDPMRIQYRDDPCRVEAGIAGSISLTVFPAVSISSSRLPGIGRRR